MKQASKWIFCGVAVGVLTACGGGSIDDSFFQADAISASAGNVCIEGAKIAQNGNEAKETVQHLKKFYAGDLNATTTVTAGIGFNATCTDYKDKAAANTIITKAYYEGTIIPATPL
jgi:hypothetical protein